MALALRQLNPIHKKGPQSFFFYISPPFYQNFWNIPKGLNFWKVLPLPFNKGVGRGREGGGFNYEATEKRVEHQQDEQLEGSEFHIMATVITNDGVWSLKLKKMKSFSYHPKVH